MTSKSPSDPPSPPPPPSTATGPNTAFSAAEDLLSSSQFLLYPITESFAFDDLDWDWELDDQNQEQNIDNYTNLFPFDSINWDDFESNDQTYEQQNLHENFQQPEFKNDENVVEIEHQNKGDLNSENRQSICTKYGDGDDGYDWKKYGNKQVKGGEKRSYYKCRYPTCLMKKKVETSCDGNTTRIVYRGNHNHTKPQSVKQTSSSSGSDQLVSDFQGPSRGSGQQEVIVTQENLIRVRNYGKTESEENEDNKVRIRTISDIDILTDGYKWKKYGQKMVKENPNPRSYFRCTSPGCPVRKQVERAPDDIKSVITTYEWRHNHPLPKDDSGRDQSSSRPVYSANIVGNMPVNLSSQAINSSDYASTMSFYPPPEFGFTRFRSPVRGPYMNQQQMFSEDKDEPKDGSNLL